jgi:hypothetical protein
VTVSKSVTHDKIMTFFVIVTAYYTMNLIVFLPSIENLLILIV